MDRNHYLLRRLHSLTGIVPIGVFLIVHLLTNSSIVWGKFGLRGAHGDLSFQDGGVAYFWEEVRWINEQIPHLILIEVALWASIAFHSILGVVYALGGRNNVSRYGYGGNKRYALQRLSGYAGILFIFYHVATLRWGWTWLVPGGVEWSHQASVSTLAMAIRGGEDFTAIGFVVALGYFIGVSMLVFHFANGLWTAAITWGLTITAKSQKRWGAVCAAVGVALMGLAWASLIGVAVLSPSAAQSVEEKLTQGEHRPTDRADAGSDSIVPGR